MIKGITCSAFDLLHAGHILMLEEAKNDCDYLIVCLQANFADRPEKIKLVQTLYERFIQLKAVKYVDEIVVYESEHDLENIFATTDARIRFIGEDYVGKNFTAKDICLERSIVIHYNKRKHSYSSTELKRRVITTLLGD